MKDVRSALMALTVIVSLTGVAAAEPVRRTLHEEAGRVWGEMADQIRSLGAQLERHLRGAPEASSMAERPLISYMLDHRQELGLSPEQTSRLEALRSDFAREAIRREAAIRVAEMDLADLLGQDPLDIAKVEAKIHEIARLRAGLRVERLRTIEQGKAVLTAEQRSKLRSLLGVVGGPRRIADDGARL